MDPVNGRQSGEIILELTADSPGRIDAIVAAALPGHTRGRVQKLIELGLVTVNGEVVRKSGQVKIGDALSVTELPQGEAAAPPDFDLPILYEDADLAVINKPAHLAVHGAPGDNEPGVAGWWLARLGETASLSTILTANCWSAPPAAFYRASHPWNMNGPPSGLNTISTRSRSNAT